MAVVTYEYDSWSSNPGPNAWSNPDYAVDGQQGNNATVHLSLFTSSGKLTLDSNDCPGTNLGTITKVEIGLWWDADDPVYTATAQPDGGSTVGPYFLAGDALEWKDATSAHATGWTWANIDATDIDVWTFLNFDGFGPATSYIDQVYIRITYDIPTGPSNISTLSGIPSGDVGKVCDITYTNIAKICGVS